ncbi:2-hydroxychromene-2-carboxylate isomerase [Oleomonas cavernae]|uniref:2-hydroxychromene-2-carboxylate isomerase n=1 Tax=Oleomonas cavernae TaxID=2320859 RepID=A0A418WGR4_9PROT|nr:2-hydroxychromene-2-carboxylate isomerase [Oleomonas cavernae]RJF89069.1 2-hydroxychromene-2-carboxylate isomerase [Oleomonas cavernae]
MSVEFVFDYQSPYAYLASTQLAGLGVPIDYTPIAIVKVMKAVNNRPSPECPPKARYAGLDARRWAELYGVPFGMNQQFRGAAYGGGFEVEALMRGALVAGDEGVIAAYNAVVFGAIWGQGADIVTAEGRRQAFHGTGIDIDALWDKAADPAIAARLEGNNARAVDRGVFGVPTFFVGEEMFFGNDRLDFVRRRIATGAAA